MRVTVVDGDLPLDLELALRSAARVAVDTETSGLDWVSDRLHICQLFAPTTGPVILRNVGGQPKALARLLSDADVVKVFHFAPFDLRFLEAHWGIQCASVECTKAASRILEPDLPPAQHSLQPLLKRWLQVSISKGAVRTSDWSAPKLSDAQLEYAVADVAHLLALSSVLNERLAAEGTTDLFKQVCAYMPIDAHLSISGIPNPLKY